MDREFRVNGLIPNNVFKTQSMVFDGTNRKGYVNGVNVYSDSSITGSISYDGNPAFVLVARSSTSIDQFLNGNVAEVLYFKNALTLSELQKIESYLRQKYNHY